MTPSDLGNQRCNKCFLVKLITDFPRNGVGRKRRANCKACHSESKRHSSLIYYYENKERRNEVKAEYTRRRMENDKWFREHVRLRRLIRRYRSIGASKSEVDDHRLVSRETYLQWLNYQQNHKKVAYGYVIDHSYPQAKLNVNDSIDRLIATNVVNFSPMSAADNATKGCKVIPELLVNQISASNAFLATADLSYDEKLKFRFLTEMFKAYIRFKLGVE